VPHSLLLAVIPCPPPFPLDGTAALFIHSPKEYTTNTNCYEFASTSTLLLQLNEQEHITMPVIEVGVSLLLRANEMQKRDDCSLNSNVESALHQLGSCSAGYCSASWLCQFDDVIKAAAALDSPSYIP
jgi:hypothetical protein